MLKKNLSNPKQLTLRKFFSLLLAVVMLVSLFPAAAYATFSDVQGHWGQTAIEKWSELGIIRGADGAFRPDDPITRGEMAVIVDNVMHYQTKAENGFSDLGQAFYTDAILKANAAGVMNGDGTAVRPADNITREEAAVMLGRALGLKEKAACSAAFSDAAEISAWAAGYINAMAGAGYVQGANGQFKPKASITRAEVVAILNNSIKQLYNETKEYTGNVSGMAIVNTPGVVLKDLKISGDLIIAEGVGKGDLTLNNVTVIGNTLVRGGGSDSIHIQGNSQISRLIVKKTDNGSIRIATSEGAVVEGVVVEDGTDDIILTGAFANITVAADVGVKAVDAKIGQVDVTAGDAVLSVDKDSVIGTLNVAETAADTKITVSGRVDALTANAKISVNNTGTITKAQINANGVAIEGNAPSTVNAAASVTDKPAAANSPTSSGTSSGGGGGGGSSHRGFAGGSGTVSSPYQIATAAQLDRVRNYLDKHFILTADIDLSGCTNWTPIGTFQPLSEASEDAETPNPAVAFTGTFNGNSHTISNVKINMPEGIAVGLFGCAAGNIYDLTVNDVDLTGYFLAGGVVGYQASSCTLENVSLTGSNTIRGCQATGGIAGGGFGDLISCDAVADIVVLGNGGCAAGVLAGGQEGDSVIDSCTAVGTVTAAGDNCFGLGGLAGQACQEGEGVTDCRATVVITASGANNSMIGGLIGYTGTYDEDTLTQITQCSADVTIIVSDSTNRVGGLVGGSFYYESYSEDNPEPTLYRITGCTTMGTTTGGGSEGSIGSIAGYAYNSTVENCTSTMIINGDSNPHQVGLSETAFAGGSGTESDPYQIETAVQLNRVRNYLDKSFILTADIDLGGYENWQPIGAFQPLSDAPEDAERPNPAVAFTGTFNGNSHTVSNVKIDLPEGIGVGLFGCAAGTEETSSSIYNLTVENVDITGYYLVSGVVGYQYSDCILVNINLTGKNTVCGNFGVGGISGGISGGVVTGAGLAELRDCDADANIVLLGDNANSGGVIGGAFDINSVTGCTATGTVTAEGDNCFGLGGLVGGVMGMEITNCQADNVTITASGENNLMVGGLLGYAGIYGEYPPMSVMECSADATILVSDRTNRVGGLVGGSLYHEMLKDEVSVPLSYAIANCSTSGTITGGGSEGSIGSIAGYAYDSTVENCTSTMTINGNSNPPQVGLSENAFENLSAWANSGSGSFESLVNYINDDSLGDVWNAAASSETAQMMAGMFGVQVTDGESLKAMFANMALTPANNGTQIYQMKYGNDYKTIDFCDNNGNVIESHPYTFVESNDNLGMLAGETTYVFKADDNAGMLSYIAMLKPHFDEGMDQATMPAHVHFYYAATKDTLSTYKPDSVTLSGWMPTMLQMGDEFSTADKKAMLECLFGISEGLENLSAWANSGSGSFESLVNYVNDDALSDVWNAAASSETAQMMAGMFGVQVTDGESLKAMFANMALTPANNGTQICQMKFGYDYKTIDFCDNNGNVIESHPYTFVESNDNLGMLAGETTYVFKADDNAGMLSYIAMLKPHFDEGMDQATMPAHVHFYYAASKDALGTYKPDSVTLNAWMPTMLQAGDEFSSADKKAMLEYLFGINNANEEQADIGILVVAHGSGEEWNQSVRESVAEVEVPYPVELGFLDVETESIPMAVQALEEKGVKRIVAVPIFICSASSHMEEIKYMLGLPSSIDDTAALEDGLERIEITAAVELTSALDDHLLIAEILDKRVENLSQNAAQEIVVLVAHGTSDPDNLAVWKEKMASLGNKLLQIHGFKQVGYGFVGAGTPGIKTVVEEVINNNPDCTVIVMPVMLSEGVYTSTKIPDALDGITYLYPEAGQRALLPHANIALYIASRANDAIMGDIEVQEAGQTYVVRYSDVALEEGGKICVCGSFAYRAIQEALEVLSPGAVAERSRFTVVGPNSDGTEAALRAILGDGRYQLEDRPHNENYYSYQITDCESGTILTVKALSKVFPDNFFALKTKIKNNTASSEEKKAFQVLRAQLVEKVRWEDADKLFAIEENVAFAGGSGTESDPYQIATAEQLDGVRNCLDKHFILTADIDLSGYENWVPIGTFQAISEAEPETPDPEVAFTGTFNGNNHTISNVKIDQPTGFAVGLFGCAAGTESNPGSIHDLTVENVDATGYFIVGGVVGWQALGYNIENVSLTGSNTVRGYQATGGISGVAFSNLISCNAAADILVLGDGGAWAGVLLGGGNAVVNDCTATGTITAEGNNCFGLGGLAGDAGYDQGAEVTNCHADVIITALGENNTMIGGLLGFTGTFGDDAPSQITGCSANSTIKVSNSAERIGGLVGGSFYHELYADERPVPSSYAIYDCETSGTITGGGSEGSIGSITGYAYNSTVDNCTSTMTWDGGSLEQIGLIESSQQLETQFVESDEQELSSEESGNVDAGIEETGSEESGNVDSGNEGSGNEESGNVDSDTEETGSEESGNMDAGNEGSGNEEPVNVDAGNAESGDEADLAA